MELRHLKYFVSVAENLNFRKAAESLHIAQPGLSRQIMQLENELECQLFDRNKRNVSLTRAGEYFLSEVRFVLNHLASVTDHVRQIQEGLAGELRIGYVGSAMQTVAPAILDKLYHDFPAVSTVLTEMNNQEQLNKIIDDQLDVGFVRVQAVPENLQMIPLHTDSFSVVLPMDHPLDKQSFRSIDQLSNESFILFSGDYSPHYYAKIISICEDKGFYPKISHRSVHAYTIFKLVESGMGVAIIPTSLKTGYQLNVKFLEIKNIAQKTTLSAIWSVKNRNPVLHTIAEIIQNKKPTL